MRSWRISQICILVMLFCLAATTAIAETTSSVFSIAYDHAGLTHISVRNDELVYTWRTERKAGEGSGMLATQSFSHYDRHELAAWLTHEELEAFRSWATKNPVSRFKAPFPGSEGASSYGSAFETSLTVVLGDSHQATKWNGDNRIPPELSTAVSDLVGLADAVEKRRRKP